jgi:hypothetical protein
MSDMCRGARGQCSGCLHGRTRHWSGRSTRQAFFRVRVSVSCGPPLTAGVRLQLTDWRGGDSYGSAYATVCSPIAVMGEWLDALVQSPQLCTRCPSYGTIVTRR